MNILQNMNSQLESKYRDMNSILKQENIVLQDQIVQMQKQSLIHHQQLFEAFDQKCSQWSGIVQTFKIAAEDTSLARLSETNLSHLSLQAEQKLIDAQENFKTALQAKDKLIKDLQKTVTSKNSEIASLEAKNSNLLLMNSEQARHSEQLEA